MLRDVGIRVMTELQLSTHFLVGTNIEFGDLYVLHDSRIFGDRSINIFHARAVYVVMSLHADTIDRNAGILHLLHHIIYTVALGWVGSIIVVIDKESLWVCFTSILEGLGDELVAAELEGTALAIRTRFGLLPWHTTTVAIGNGLVDNIPSIYHIFITIYNRMDVFAQTSIENLLAHFLAFLVDKHPVAELVMPAKTMATQFDAIRTTEVGYLVCIFPVPLPFFRLQRNRFHIIFCRDTIKVFLDESNLCRISDVSHVHSYTDREIALIGVFVACWVDFLRATQRLSRSRSRAHEHRHGDNRDSDKFNLHSLFWVDK